jgi:hypothetical protein
LSVTVALPLPLTAAVIVTVDAAMCAIGPGEFPVAVATNVGAGGLTNETGAEVPSLEPKWRSTTSGPTAVARRGVAASGWAARAVGVAKAGGELPRRCELGRIAWVSGAETAVDGCAAAGTMATL